MGGGLERQGSVPREGCVPETVSRRLQLPGAKQQDYARAAAMPPPLTSRVRVPACARWLHVMNRVAEGEAWLNDAPRASAFVAQVERICAAFPIDVHAYCALPRHFHLLVRAEPAPLSAALSELQSQSGFPGRAAPRALPVTFGRHLTGVSRYIHLNPVLAGLVRRPEHWLYSSFRAYLGDLAAPRFVVTAAVLGRFGTIGARHRHRAYVYAGLDPETRDQDGRPRWSVLLPAGSAACDLAWRIPPVLATQALPSHVWTPTAMQY